MNVYSFNPLQESRWTGFVAGHPSASIFHTGPWLQALQRTYGFTPIAFTTSRPSEALKNALVFSDVRSWLTGRRLVSLPFSDHCEPLVDSPEELHALCSSLLEYRAQGRWKYIEMRPASAVSMADARFGSAQTFYLHRLDLRPDLDTLFRGLHRDSIQRKIRRAERERLTYEEGRSESLLRQLRHLLDLTRRRHQAPLQSVAWFRNLVDALGEDVCVRIVRKHGELAAGILTLAFGDTVVYKYGGSDARLNALGGMPFLFWRTIEAAKRQGARELDLGRSDRDNTGLVTFKNRLSASRSTLTYWRFPAETMATVAGWKMRCARRVFARLPGRLRRAAGTLLYPHLG